MIETLPLKCDDFILGVKAPGATARDILPRRGSRFTDLYLDHRLSAENISHNKHYFTSTLISRPFTSLYFLSVCRPLR